MISNENPSWNEKPMPSRNPPLTRFCARVERCCARMSRMNGGLTAVAPVLGATTRSIVGISLLAVSAGLIACANTDNIPPLYHARTLLEQQQQAQAAEQIVLDDFARGINPEWNVPISGIYDQADRYRTARGFPLPGWAHMFFGR
jgi:hypothetical protein